MAAELGGYYPRARRYGPCTPARFYSSSTGPSAAVIDVHKAALPAQPSGRGTQARVTICNANKMNVAHAQVVEELQASFEALREDTDLRVVVLTGQSSESKSPAFCGGADIRQMAALSTPDEARAFITRLYDLCEAIRTLDAITIARIDGVCLGAGLEIAASCDFRYATRRSRFSMPETAVGVPSVIQARLLSNIVGWQKAKKLMTFANVFDAEEASAMGLLDFEADSVQGLDEQLDRDIATLGGLGMTALRSQKRLFRLWEEESLDTGLTAGIDSFAAMFEDGGTEPKHFMNGWMAKQEASKQAK